VGPKGGSTSRLQSSSGTGRSRDPNTSAFASRRGGCNRERCSCGHGYDSDRYYGRCCGTSDTTGDDCGIFKQISSAGCSPTEPEELKLTKEERTRA
jgi:hypothetical protein